MSNEPLSRDQILEALSELADRLSSRGQQARIYIVGGAAIVLSFNSRDLTRDVDAQYTPRDVVEDVAQDVARQHGLPSDWLNAHAAGFISPVVDDQKSEVIIENDLVEVRIASAEVLLAMKIRSSRPRLDVGDIKTLLKHLEIKDLTSAIKIYDNYYPEDPLPARAKPLLDSILTPKVDLSRSINPRF